MIVPQTLPDSRDTVENSAAANASTSPTIATRNRIQTSGSRKRPSCGEDACEDRDEDRVALESSVLLGVMGTEVQMIARASISRREGGVEVTEDSRPRPARSKLTRHGALYALCLREALVAHLGLDPKPLSLVVF